MSKDPLINLPHVVEAVRLAFEDYECALLANQLEVLDDYFWSTEHTVRYGIAENLYGARDIAAYRRVCVPVGPGRKLRNTVICTFDENYATVSTEFSDAETRRTGRQMQTWVRFADGWKVVAAHVSVDLSTL
ncbi:oxalurate catabolism protein HpxZ [Pseudomonas sp. MYb185]|uniref:oxalurate catabolism protein HpxZ n=1 Tax=Pseudomonas sp. MYb185 TaxID=1848729 RepID=UPI000CFCEF8A|nr:oxalurate catabolism protein HpxZ [Pseudomonas sp. MYb185]PRB75743.1 DUF4440 domain-containing protein [Pseudomonas sp. MYb185]